MSNILAGSYCALLVAAGAAHADEKRGFYVEAGAGYGRPSYGDELDDALDSVDDVGYDRLSFSLDLAMGGAVSPNLYVVGSLVGFADRVYDPDDDDDYLQLNTYLFGVGVRYYPLPSQKHLLLGADVGLAKAVVQSSRDDDVSDNGKGFKLLVAYDIDRTPRGPTLQIGAQFMSASIEDVKFKCFSVFAKFAFK